MDCSDHSYSTSQLENRFFLYGTEPLKLPNYQLHHANSSTSLSTTSNNENNGTHHLSLNFAHNPNSRHVFKSENDLLSNHSLDKFLSNSNNENDDESNEVFEDAVETFEVPSENSSKIENHKVSSRDSTSVELVQSLNECQSISQLIFDNRLNEALRRTKEQENRSFYHSLCHSAISFIQAGMTFNQEDIESNILALRHTTNMSRKHESYRVWIPFTFTNRNLMNEYELHAKLVYAEALLLRALLTFIQDQGLISFISGALKIKECHDLFVKLAKNNDPSRFSSTISYEHFDSGVRMGNGAFNLMIANLPQRIIRYLEFAGFSGDKEMGLKELEISAFSNGLRAPLAALLLLGYHTFAAHIFGNGDGDLARAHSLTEHCLKLYPNSYLFLIFRARLLTLHCRLIEAIETYEFAIRCQQDWKNLHHIAFWEILWCQAMRRDWKKAAAMADVLLKENKWSKATSCYLLATFLFEENEHLPNDEIILLFKRVPQLKIRLAGKSIPLEKYAIKQCEHFLEQNWLFLPSLELCYLMNGFYILSHDESKLHEALDLVNREIEFLQINRQTDRFFHDSFGSGMLLRGVLLHFLRQYDQALRCFDDILARSKQYDERSLLAPNAVFEKALIYIDLKQKDKAKEFLYKALNEFKDYHLESRLHFRINAALQTIKKLENPS